MQNVVAFACISRIAKAAASVALLVETGEKGTFAPDTHPLVKLLQRPNMLNNGSHSSTLLPHVNAGRDAKAADQFPRWCHAKGKKVKGLANRRAAERAIYLGQ